MKDFKILSPTAILGYGYPESSFLKGMEENPDLIAVDAGSTDPGPFYLGSGKSFTDRLGVKRDLRIMMKAGIEKKIPIVIGSAGGSGAKSHVKWCREIIEEIAKEENFSFKLGIIYSDIEKNVVIEALKSGEIVPLECVPDLSEDIINKCTNIVAQIGVEPIIEAFNYDCDIILCGRAYDPAVFAAFPVKLGYDAGLALHLGKILECAAIAASPGSGSDSVLGILKENSFLLMPLNDERIFTKESSVAHSLYEKSDPYFLPGPGGRLNLSECSFEEVGGGIVEVKGSKFEATEDYYIKLEGAVPSGYRTISIAGSHDPVMIKNIADILEDVNNRVKKTIIEEGIKGDVFIRVYGKNGVMGSLEPLKVSSSHEIGILIEAVSPDKKDADTICSLTRSTLLHYGYPGRISTAGNLAFPFSPSDISMGEVFCFGVYHLMRLGDRKLFRIETKDIVAGRS